MTLRDFQNWLARLHNVSGQCYFSFPESRTSVERLNVVVNEVSSRCHHHGVQTDALRYDWRLDVFPIHLVRPGLAPFILLVTELVRIVLYGSLFSDSIDGSELFVRNGR